MRIDREMVTARMESVADVGGDVSVADAVEVVVSLLEERRRAKLTLGSPEAIERRYRREDDGLPAFFEIAADALEERSEVEATGDGSIESRSQWIAAELSVAYQAGADHGGGTGIPLWLRTEMLEGAHQQDRLAEQIRKGLVKPPSPQDDYRGFSASRAEVVAEGLRDWVKRADLGSPGPAPLAMRLTCPTCGALHVDEGDFATRPHHTHACQICGACWRPALIATVGVRFLPGFKDSPPTLPEVEPTSTEDLDEREERARLAGGREALARIVGVASNEMAVRGASAALLDAMGRAVRGEHEKPSCG